MESYKVKIVKQYLWMKKQNTSEVFRMEKNVVMDDIIMVTVEFGKGNGKIIDKMDKAVSKTKEERL
jgi:hypothetical protein